MHVLVGGQAPCESPGAAGLARKVSGEEEEGLMMQAPQGGGGPWGHCPTFPGSRWWAVLWIGKPQATYLRVGFMEFCQNK